MSDQTPNNQPPASPVPGSQPTQQLPPGYGAPAPSGYVPAPPPGYVPAPGYGYAPMNGPIGKVRSTGLCILLCIVTFGIYSLVWFYSVHNEMKRHTNQGMGGPLALVLAFFIGIVMPYLTSSEVGGLFERAGQRRPVGGATGLWYFPGIFILVGPLVWFIRTNHALNNYWRSVGAR